MHWQLLLNSNDEASWRELLMLTNCVLCAPGRGGKQHKRAVHGSADLPPEAAQSRASVSAERRDMATSLVCEGFDRKACAALLSKGLCGPAEETARAKRHFPSSPPPTTAPLQDLAPGCEGALPA